MVNQNKKAEANRKIDWLFIILICAFAFGLNLMCGQRGFFAFDQSIIFDGGYRIYAGQKPYRDFFIPTGPIVFWLQSIFFRLGGINYFIYILHASVINVLAVLLSIVVLRWAMPESKFFSYAAGLLTAVWFYPPFGTPWFEQTAFFFNLLILSLVSGVIFKSFKGGLIMIFGAGLCQTLSILSKQNAGLFFLFIPVGILLITRHYFYLLTFSLGMSCVVIGFFIWLWLFSSPQNFYTSFFLIPSKLGLLRLFQGSQSHRLWLIFFGSPAIVVQLILSILAAISAIYYLRKGKILAVKYLVIVGLVVFQYIIAYTSDNQVENSFPYTGLILCLTWGLFYEAKGFELNTKLGGIFALFLYLTIFFLGVKISVSRVVQDIFSKSKFISSLNIPRLEILKWACPTRFGSVEIKADDIERLYNYLAQNQQNFFIFPDWTILYGLLGKPSPQPLVWFDPGITYPMVYSQKIDNWLVESLEGKQVNIIVLEKVSYIGTMHRLTDFPLMVFWISKNFEKKGEIGIFEIYHRREK